MFLSLLMLPHVAIIDCYNFMIRNPTKASNDDRINDS